MAQNNSLWSTNSGFNTAIGVSSINTYAGTQTLHAPSISTGQIKFDDGAMKGTSLTDILQDLNKKSRQVDCLTKILIQKGILTEEEINDMLTSFDVIEKISEE